MNQDKQEQARHLYFAQAKTQKEIAQLLDVSEKTIYNWIKRHSWDQLRQAAHQAPALITENLCSQIVELQNSIGRREPGNRFPTVEESVVMQRLITMLEKMKKFPGLAMSAQVMETFRTWMRPRDKAFTRDLSLYAGLFLQGYAQNGYHPHQLEFGIENISPIAPYYEEEPIAENHKPTEETKQTNPPAPNNVSLPNHVIVSPSNDVSLPNDVIVSLSNDVSPSNDVILSSSKDDDNNAQPEPEKSPKKPSQNIDDQDTYDNNTHLPAPVKTGKTPATLDRSHDFPWRKKFPNFGRQNTDPTPRTRFSPKRK